MPAEIVTQYEPDIVGPPMVELLYEFTVPLYGAVVGYALALSFAGKHRREWMARGGTMLLLIFVLGVGLVGNACYHWLGGLLANATDGRRGTFESFAAIAATAAVMPYCIGRVFRIEHRNRVAEANEDGRAS